MAPPDTRHVVGSYVHAKALHVTNKAECALHYGFQAKSEILLVTVVYVTSSVKKGGRTSTNVTCHFILAGNVTKRAELNIGNIKKGRIPTTTVVTEVEAPAVPTAANPGAPERTNPTASEATTTDASFAAEITQGLEEMTDLAATSNKHWTLSGKKKWKLRQWL
jgi:hypothetical protein